MRSFPFKLCVALLCFACGVYAGLAGRALRPRLAAAPPPSPRPAPPPAAGPSAPLCEIHRAEMRVERVPVHYGMPVNAPARFEAERTLFPNSRRFHRGGCVAREEKHREVSVCPACRAAEEGWRRAHPREP